MLKQKVSYVVSENYYEIGHNSGINSLALDTQTPGGLLYTAGKDAKVISWNLHLDKDNINPYYIKRENDNNDIGKINVPQAYSSFNDIHQENDLNIDNIEFNESPQSLEEYSLLKNYCSEDISSSNQTFPLNGTTHSIAISKNFHKLKQQYSQNFDLRRKKCVIKKPTFNKSYWYHSDWVNDIVLTANKDHLISASSDRSIYLWDIKNNLPSARIGFHKDDVRVLAYSAKRNWVASGGFDEKVLFWDLNEGRAVPIFNSDDSKTQNSIYSMATNTEGNVLVTGSPERIVRIWDTRLGKQVLKLTGHSDNVRALIVSEDGKWVISGSSDSSIKLWSISNTKKCVMTYSFYSDSVWSLASNDPFLKTFWAGGRDGCITKINQSSNYDYNNQYDNDYGDCVLICKENAGVVKLAAIDNGYVYAATSSSNVNCWRDIPLNTRALKPYINQNPEDFEKVVIPKSSVITQSTDIINESLYTFNKIESVASINTHSVSLSNNNNNFMDNDFSNRITYEEDALPLFTEPEVTITGKPPIVKFTIMNDRRHVLTQDSEKNVDEWDIILCKKTKKYGKVDYDKVLKETNKRIYIENWCSLDIHTGSLKVSLVPNQLFESLYYYDECIEEDMLVPESLIETRVNVGRWVLTNLFYNFIMTNSNKNNSEINEENNEKDEKDENNPETEEESNSNVGKNNNNVNINVIRGENGNHKGGRSNSSIHCATPLLADDSSSISDSAVDRSVNSLQRFQRKESLINAIANQNSLSRTNSQKFHISRDSPMFPELKGDYSEEEEEEEEEGETNDDSYYNNPLSDTTLPTPDQEKEDSSNLVPPVAPLENNNNNMKSSGSGNHLVPPSINQGLNSQESNRSLEKSSELSSTNSIPSLSKNNSEKSTSNNLQVPSTLSPMTPTKDQVDKTSNPSINGNGSVERRKSENGPTRSRERSIIHMIRSRVHIRSTSGTRQKESKKSISGSNGVNPKSSASSTSGTTTMVAPLNANVNPTSNANSTPALNPSLNPNVNPNIPSLKVMPEPKTDGPINFAECPYVRLPNEVPVIISSLESDDAITYIDQDRATVGSLGDPNTGKYLCDNAILPRWVYDCVINQKLPNIEIRKVNFVLMPYPGSEMPALPLGNNRLCANRMLRVRKILAYVVDKLNLNKSQQPKSNKASNISLSDFSANMDGVKAENWIELLCNDEVLPPTTTLATCRNHYSKTSGDVVLQYRYIVKEIK